MRIDCLNNWTKRASGDDKPLYSVGIAARIKHGHRDRKNADYNMVNYHSPASFDRVDDHDWLSIRDNKVLAVFLWENADIMWFEFIEGDLEIGRK
jgi:hypothetical protein